MEELSNESAPLSSRTAPDSLCKPVVSVRNLSVRFMGRESTVRAVNGLSFDLAPGEVLGILGESGSGKSVTLRALMRLLPATAQIEGQVRLAGYDVLALTAHQLANVCGTEIAMIFQEPATALDPVFTIGQQIRETIIRHDGVSRRAATARALELMEKVQIPSPERRLDAYPHELSGGMRQRAMIALALSCRPKVLLADEPTTALDVTVQMQILLLLRQLQEEFGMAVIFVTHDVGVAVEISDRLAVMYAGRFVEHGPMRTVIRKPLHPYTQGLLHATVHGSMRGQRLHTIPGEPPNLVGTSRGCSFAARCSYAIDECTVDDPPRRETTPGHMFRCIRMEEGGGLRK